MRRAVLKTRRRWAGGQRRWRGGPRGWSVDRSGWAAGVWLLRCCRRPFPVPCPSSCAAPPNKDVLRNEGIGPGASRCKEDTRRKTRGCNLLRRMHGQRVRISVAASVSRTEAPAQGKRRQRGDEKCSGWSQPLHTSSQRCRAAGVAGAAGAVPFGCNNRPVRNPPHPQGCIGRGGAPPLPPSRAPSLCLATVPLCNRQ